MSIFRKATIWVVLAAMATPVQAAEVSLRSRGGELVITGELAAHDATAYILRSPKFGVMMLEASKFDCIGAGCPGASAARFFGVHGSNTIGAQLMPSIIEAYAASSGLGVEKRVGADAEEVDIILKEKNGTEVVTINLQSHGSGASAPALAARKADIGMSSRPIKPEEAKAVADAGLSPRAHVVALDGLIVFVSPENPLQSLTLEQIAKIFAGEITDWSQLGLPPRKINVYARDDKSGTFDTFDSLVLKPFKLKISLSAKRFESTPDLSDSVARDPAGIGFGGFAYLRNAKALSIATSCGIVSPPSQFLVKTEEYPLARRLYLYTTNIVGSPMASKILEFALSDAAQQAVTDAGFIDQKVDYQDFATQGERVAIALSAPEEDFNLPLMRQLLVDLRGARRLSLTFRFDKGSVKLDERAQQDAARLMALLQSPELQGREIMLIGFADSAGPFEANRAVSLNRANAVRQALVALGGSRLNATKISVKAFGEIFPVACNDTEAGRETNRRVEVWVK